MTKAQKEDGCGLMRLVPVRDAGRTVKHLAVDASEQECARLALWLGIPSMQSFKAEMTLKLWQRDGLKLEGEGRAAVTLLCGVTAQGFGETLSFSFARSYAPPPADIPRKEIDLSAEESDADAEELPSGSIDLGAILAEELSLAVPAWPRKPDAVFATGAAVMAPAADETPKKPNPFNALKDLAGKSAKPAKS